MALVHLIDICKNFETKKILENATFHMDEGERVVIVGKNGTGKSTLMKIITGEMDFDEGDRVVQQNLEVKMLPQNPVFEAGVSVKEAIEMQLVELKKAKDEYEALSLRLSNEYDNNELLNQHAKLSAYLDHHSAWNLDDKIERVMQEFKLKEFENSPVNLLSGGEQRRVALAGLLLQKPDLLLLDEPTNHLDVYMVEFLEELLLKERFTLLFISHDRYFIDNIATRTIEIDDGVLRGFRGGYSNYLEEKTKILEVMQKQHENLLRLLRSENEWYARGVRARLKRNEGRKERLMDLRDKAKTNPSLIRKMKVELDREAKHFNRQESINKQKLLFELEDISITLGNKQLIKDFSYRILQKDRIAVVGKNGSGKSTLLKVLLNRLKIDSGKIKRGEFKIGYFDQHREMLDNNKNLIETFCPFGGDRVEVQGKNMHVYGYLKNFLFPKEYLDKKVGLLSGGEKNRVALALLFTKNVDCLILDEPTNDLDIPTINILEEKLLHFPGAVLLVSHDRYFVDKLAKKLFVFKGKGEVIESHQSYTEYLELEKELRELDTYEYAPLKEKSVKVKEKKLKLTYKEQQLLKKLPDEIEALEERVIKLNEDLSNPAVYEEVGITTLAQELEEVEQTLEEKTELYLEIEEKREEIENEQI